MRVLKRFAELSLRKKFIGLILITMVINWLFLLCFHQYAIKITRTEFEKRGKLLTRTIATQSVYNLVMEDRESLQKTIDNLLTTHDANAAAFYNKTGEIIAGKNLDLLKLDLTSIRNMEHSIQWGKTINDIPVLVSIEKITYQTNHEDVGYFLVSIPANSIREQKITAWWISAFGIIAFVAFMGVLMIFLNKYIITPILNLNQAAREVADGNFDYSIECYSRDEIGSLYESFQTMLTRSKTLLNELKEKQEEAEKARDYAEMMQQRSEEQQEYLEEQFQRIEAVISAATAGDLTMELEVKREDVVGKLMMKINQMVADLRNIITEVHTAGKSISQASSEIATSAEGMFSGAKEQAEQTTEVAAAIEEMSRTILESSQNAAEAVEIARGASDLANKGEKVFEETLEGMKKIAEIVTQAAKTVDALGKSSIQIGEIIQVIDDIADQTNLLALNAAIEAARAGEHGRGFAVVADEVRKLAERTTAATKEIGEMITRIQQETDLVVQSMTRGTSEVKKGMTLADKAGESLKEIISSVNDIVNRINQIAAATHEQSSASEEISRNVERISSVADQISQATQNLAFTSENLNGLTEHLKALIERFQLEKGVHAVEYRDSGNGKPYVAN